MPIILVVVLIIILVAVYFLFIRGILNRTTTTTNTISSHTTSTTIQGQGSTSVPVNAVAAQPITINITAINLEWYYKGPASVQNSICGGAYFKGEPANYYYSSFYWSGGYTGGGTAPPVGIFIINSTNNTAQNVSFGSVLYSGAHCSITATAINTTTPGFNITTIVPATPFTIQSNSSAEVIFTVTFPKHDFKGPLSINFYEKGKAAT